ncbi:Sfi1-domain-containing protein [Aspergillus sclerotioniger CBS 115572]|uniref:Sfi1-domain-containing protein n=1 Tax=Aspergillus sclerotioniger CBS 115572 TaxID=1450535 RepID=A0A317X812_9EURO|nr:Sfi1-domain-containing protein [Aspergillus sclerotioniger CBS 115572]PWY94754.1 Sfi1-domain-containing protein [Aspergillus sclerotioniger CBS 115572]
MPPVPLQRRPLSYEDPSLTDEDVGLLYQVITRAERDPEVERLPYRVLFNAYDEVIAEHGVDADPGYACMRFLLKMGSKDAIGTSLFEKFENLLERMGIVIEFGEDDGYDETFADSVPSIESRPRRRVRDTREDSTQPQPHLQTPLRRRASFNSMYDVGDDPTQRSLINRPSSRSSMSRLEVGKPEYPFSKPSPSPKRAVVSQEADSPDRTQLMAQFIEVGRRLMSRMDLLAAQSKPPDENPLPNGLYARSAVDRDRSERIAESARARRSKDSSNGSDEEGERSSVSSEEEGINHIERPEMPPEMLYRPSLSDLLRDASTFNMYRQRAINRRVLTQWLKRAIQARQSHHNMEIVAVNRDRYTLIRQAFETWHTIIQERRQTERTERFFKHLEERAGRARDLFLLTKAFSHWAQLTSEEVARTSAARRHLLGVKYFHAWREITAVNELKSQRFAMRRPFNTWLKRTKQIKEDEAKAVTISSEKSKHTFYWQWFWSFCEHRAPQWHDYCLKRRSLLYWLRKFRTNRETMHEIEVRNKQHAMGSILQAWLQRTRGVVATEQQAVLTERRQLLEESFGEWKAQAHLAPVASRVTKMVDTHILQAAYSQWVHRAQMLKQAREMDRQRVLRNSWTTWNDLLRCQALYARIEERLKLEAMYKWILTERYRLMQRIREQRIKREVFSIFVTSVRGTYAQLLDRAEVFEDQRNEDLLRSKLERWRDQLALQRDREVVASEFYAPRLAQESLVAWRSKFQHLIKIEGWAQNARFYFLATKFTKKWRVATIESARKRRQDAYIQTRRRIKITLASKALSHWHSKSQHVTDMEQQAIQVSRQNSLSLVSEILIRWQEKTINRIQDCEDADNHYAHQIVSEQLTRWTEAFLVGQRQEEQANNMNRVHVLAQANIQLRKLSFRVFQVKSSSETADAMKERNLRKHCRGMFRSWLEKARIRSESRDAPGPLVSPTKNYDGASPYRTDTNQRIFDPWYQTTTPFKPNGLVVDTQPISTTPLATPNYLTSPSKRAARAQAMAQASTTPATPLYTPFASRLLRAGAILPRTTSARRRAGRASTLGTSVRFVDEEPPESPTDGRKSASRRP